MSNPAVDPQVVPETPVLMGDSFPKKMRRLAAGLFPYLTVIVLALFVGAVLIVLSGQSPLAAYQSMVLGAFGDVPRLTETLIKTIPLLLMGLGISIAFKGGFWNIGGEGQLLAGAVFSTWVALNLSGLPGPLLIVLSLAAGFAGGAFWCLIPGILKIKFNVNEVISTLMLNYVALFGVMYLIRGPMSDQTSAKFTGMVFPQTALIPQNTWLPILVEKTRLHAGLIVVLMVLVLVWLLWRTRFGFEIELLGSNVDAARYAGVNINRGIILISILSGGLAGLVGWNEIFGVHHRILDAITGGYGYLGIVVALLAGLHPFALVLSSLLFSGLTVGGAAMERATGVSFAIVNVINGFVIVFLLVRSSVQRMIWGEK